MVSVSEATAIIQNYLWKASSEQVELLNSLHRVLAESIVADRDFPPFDRVTMDGIAIVYSSYENGQRSFVIDGLQAAGMPQKNLSSLTVCIEVMTGAMLPVGADTVVRYEDLKIVENKAEVTSSSINRLDNIHRTGSDARQKELLIAAATVITSAEIPIMAAVGKSVVSVYSLPRTAVVSTGDELVNIQEKPQAHQIRKSNGYALAAGLARHGIQSSFFHLADNETSIKQSLEIILSNHDLIILSGGVSKGKFDLIPAMLESFGIQKHFHQVKQRPGKPMWFGTGKNQVVFALPGNPVSTFLCFYQYIEPWLLKSWGANPSPVKAILNADVTFNLPLTYFLQVKVRNENGHLFATTIPGGGSGDFVNLKDVDGFLELPEGVVNFKKGVAFTFISFRK